MRPLLITKTSARCAIPFHSLHIRIQSFPSWWGLQFDAKRPDKIRIGHHLNAIECCHRVRLSNAAIECRHWVSPSNTDISHYSDPLRPFKSFRAFKLNWICKVRLLSELLRTSKLEGLKKSQKVFGKFWNSPNVLELLIQECWIRKVSVEAKTIVSFNQIADLSSDWP